nr:unnamed protein product [Digitaria exilis]
MRNKPPEVYYETLRVGRDASPQGVRAAYMSLALLDQQESRAVLAARDGENVAVSAAARAARGEKKPGAAAAVDAPCTPPPAAKAKVYSACSNVGGGRSAFAEFSSYVVRKAPPLERRVECTLEELCSGCSKEVRYTRDVVTKNGMITKKEVTQTIRVRPGMRKGATVTLEGAGDERPGCLAGDAVFVVSEKKHRRFKRLGDDLVLRARVPLVSALTGWHLSFRLLCGDKFRCTFRDEVISPGYVKVVKGGGMPVAGGEKGARGDLMIKFEVVFPDDLTDEQRKGLAEILRGCA